MKLQKGKDYRFIFCATEKEKKQPGKKLVYRGTDQWETTDSDGKSTVAENKKVTAQVIEYMRNPKEFRRKQQ